MRFVSCVEATVQPGQKGLNHRAVLTDCKPPEVPVIFAEVASMSLLEVKSQLLQFLATRNPSKPEDSPVAPTEEVARFDVLADDL